MKKHLILIGATVLLLAVGLSGCNELNSSPSEEDRFVGIWKTDNSMALIDLGEVITFYSDGNASLSEFEGYWEVKGEKLIIEIPDKKVKGKYDYIFSNNDDTLEITSNMLEMTYIFNNNDLHYILNKELKHIS